MLHLVRLYARLSIFGTLGILIAPFLAAIICIIPRVNADLLSPIKPKRFTSLIT